MDIVVIGAGVIGAAVADALASGGAHVTVLDMRSPGRGASQASAGILAPYIEAEPASPLLPLAARSLALYGPFIDRLRDRVGRRVEYERRGTFQVALSDRDAAALQHAVTELAALGVQADWIDAARVAEFEPAASRSATGGLFIPIHGFVAVPSLVAALVESARSAGAHFEAPVEAVRVDARGDRVEVSADDRRYTADRVINAAGSWASRVKVVGASPVPVRPIRGQLLHLGWATSPRPQHVVWGPHCYVVPWSNGAVLVGATIDDVGFDEHATVEGVFSLTDAVRSLLPVSRHATVQEIRVGLRPSSPDGLPIIGPLPSAPRVIAAAGHYRNGVLLAPVTAEIVRRLVLDGVSDPALATTTPARFAQLQ